MQCPVCKNGLLQRETLELNIPGFKCSICAGVWLSSGEYLEWLKQQNTPLPENGTGDIILPPETTEHIKLCADCGRIMSRYRVLPNINLFLDHCGHCNGVWLDKGEWEILVARNSLGKINQFFTEPWQKALQDEETKSKLDKLYAGKLGNCDYEKLKETWNWLKDHPHRTMLLAYLQSKNPYEI